MATIIPIMDDYKSQLYDPWTGESLVTEKVVDVTDDCQMVDSERAIFIFTQARKGRIVQICFPYPNEKIMGSRIHFFIDELDAEIQASEEDDTFGRTAKHLGIDKSTLRNMIIRHAPTIV